MTSVYQISLATPDDVVGTLALQEPNLIERGGGLTVRLTAHWFGHAISDKSVLVARRDGKVVGYVLGTSLAAKANIPIIQSMVCTFLAPSDRYLYGPVCVANAERGRGLAGAMFSKLRAHMRDRPEMTFVRADNANAAYAATPENLSPPRQ